MSRFELIGKEEPAVILGIIPARGGSKGIPRKNIKEICGKPLIAWTIEAAKKSKLLDRFVVSTEDEEIANVARKYRAEVVPRPPELARDESLIWPVLQHVLQQINADVVVLLNPTSPVRDDDLIDRCIKRFLETKADSLATGFTCKLYEWGKYTPRRQALPGWFHDDGSVYVVKANFVREGKLWGERMVRMENSREQNVNVDEEFDFWLVEQILKKREGRGLNNKKAGQKNQI